MMIFVYLPVYIRDLGATDFQVGLLSTVYFLVLIVSSPFWGAMSDLLENRKLLPTASTLSFTLIFLWISICENPTQVIIGRAVLALVSPALTAPLLALISEQSSVTKRGGDISWFNAFRSFGGVLGLVIIGYLSYFLSLSLLFKLFAIYFVGLLLPLIVLPGNMFEIRVPEARKILKDMKSRVFPVKEGHSVLKEKGLMYLYLSLILRVICIVGFTSFLSIFLTEEIEFSLQTLGIFSAVGSGLTFLSMLTAGHLADVLGRRQITLFGFLLSAFTPITYSLGSEILILLWVGRVTHSIGYGFVISGISAFVGDIARKREQGSLMGWINMSFGIGGSIGPLLMGALLGSFGYVGMALFMSSFAIVGLLLTLLKVGETTRIEDRRTLREFLRPLMDLF